MSTQVTQKGPHFITPWFNYFECTKFCFFFLFYCNLKGKYHIRRKIDSKKKYLYATSLFLDCRSLGLIGPVQYRITLICLIYRRIPKEESYKCSRACKCIPIICLCNSYWHTFTVIPLWTSDALNSITFRLSTTHLKDKREPTLVLILSLLFLTFHIMKILSSLQLKNLQATTIKNFLLILLRQLYG